MRNTQGSFGLSVMIVAVIASLIVILATVAQYPTPTISPTITPTAPPTPDPTSTPTPTEISFTPTPTEEKVDLCHKNRPDARYWFIINVDKSAEAAHLGHGDFPPDNPPIQLRVDCPKFHSCPHEEGETVVRDCGMGQRAGVCSCGCEVKLRDGSIKFEICKPNSNACGWYSCKYDIKKSKLVTSCADTPVLSRRFCRCTIQDRETGEMSEEVCHKIANHNCISQNCDASPFDEVLEDCTDTGNRCECLVKVYTPLRGHIEKRGCV